MSVSFFVFLLLYFTFHFCILESLNSRSKWCGGKANGRLSRDIGCVRLGESSAVDVDGESATDKCEGKDST